MSILLSVSVKFYSIPCQKQQQEEKTKQKILKTRLYINIYVLRSCVLCNLSRTISFLAKTYINLETTAPFFAVLKKENAFSVFSMCVDSPTYIFVYISH